MNKKALRLTAFFITSICYCAWSQDTDTLKREFDEVVITGYLSRQPIAQVPASTAVLNPKASMNGSQQSLLPVMNTVPGIRMEERSPGSYRLSIRGSLLRSPFGVRNVKVYLNDLPFTDAGGNTYLNLVDPALLQRIEILKGPDGSLFGANSGGVVLLDADQNSSSVEGSVSGGAYGLFREYAVISRSGKKMSWNFGEAFQRSDGYREQSAMKQINLIGSGKMQYGTSNSLALTALFSDLHYETPGGLTRTQFQAKPEQARPPSGPVPGAIDQHTGIYNTTFFGGLTNELNISSSLRHVISVFGTLTDYENPFITNYEARTEKNTGLRTFLEYSRNGSRTNIKVHAGMEGQVGFQEIANYQNNSGVQGPLMSEDDVDISQFFYFSKVLIDVADRLMAEAAVSLNQYQYTFNETGNRKLSNEWMPRLAMSYRFTPGFSVRASVSRGYSPPTIAEIRPSGGVINETLQAEFGWNKEIGTRLSLWNGRLQADASVFRYDLSDAIVRRTDAADVEYFLNSGGTDQAGAEFLLNGVIIAEQTSGFIRKMSANVSYTLSHFRFDDYIINEESYSGNKLTGVPESSMVTGLSISLPHRVHIFFQSILTSRIPLNDANTEYADHYELVQAKVGWVAAKKETMTLEIFAGADNILNQHYSLGHDINAFGGRYYNAAALRNFYAGVNVRLY